MNKKFDYRTWELFSEFTTETLTFTNMNRKIQEQENG